MDAGSEASRAIVRPSRNLKRAQEIFFNFPFPAGFFPIRMLAKLGPNSREVIDKNSFTINNRRSNATRSFKKFRLESKWNATFLFVPAEISESNGTYEKEVLFFQMEYFLN